MKNSECKIFSIVHTLILISTLSFIIVFSNVGVNATSEQNESANITATIPANVTTHANITATIPANVTIPVNVTSTIPANVTTHANNLSDILDEILTWHLYDFNPDQIIFSKALRIMGEGPSGHALWFDGKSNHVEYVSKLANTTNIMTSAWIKPIYNGSNHYTILNSAAGFNLELMNSTRQYHVQLSIYDGSLWHVFQFPDPIQEKWTNIFAMYDGKSAIIGVNGKFKEGKIFHDESFVMNDTAYAKFENLPPDVIYYVGPLGPHIHIGASHYHAIHFSFFSGLIDNVVIYPLHAEVNLGILFPTSNAARALNGTILDNVTSAILGNVTSSILGNVTTFGNVTASVPSNATTSTNMTTAIPSNVTIPVNVTSTIPPNVITRANLTTSIPANVTANQILSNATKYLTFSGNSTHGLKREGNVQLGEGLNGTALELKGSGLVTASVNQTNTLTGLTVSAWVKPNYEEGSNVFTIASKDRSFLLQINNNISPQRVVTFSIFDGIQWHTIESNSTIGEEWTHVVGTFDGNEIGIYVNGQREATLPVTGITLSLSGQIQVKNVTSLKSLSDVLVGAEVTQRGGDATVKNLFSGSIDDFSIFKYRLKDTDIATLFEQGDELKQQLSISTLPVMPSLKTLKNNYLITENPTFEFQYYTESDLKAAVNVIKPSLEPIQYDGWNKGNESISVDVIGPDGNHTSIKSEVKKLREGKFDIQFGSERAVKPGLYNLKITLVKDGKSYTSESTYEWGLVSFNTFKSIYKPGDNAKFVIVVLDNTGHSVCNANVVMNIKDPTSNTTNLSTGNGITADPECGLYDAQYFVPASGNYTVDIAAQNPSGTANFTSSFLAQDNSTFDVARTAQSKIDPVNNPNSFKVNIDVTSFVNTNNVIVKESVPSIFDLVTDANVQIVGDTKILTWNKNLIGNKTSVQYSYSVPLVFPQLYALGPVEIDYGTQSFKEARSWFVANDPTSKNSITALTTSSVATLSTASFTNSVGSTYSILLVFVSATQSMSVSSVTWGLNSLTHFTGVTLPVTSSARGEDLWYLINPPAGSNAVTANFAANQRPIGIGAIFVRNVNSASPFGASIKNTATSTAPSITLISQNKNSIVIAGFTIDKATAATISGTNSTLKQIYTANQGTRNLAIVAGNITSSNGGSHTISTAAITSTDWNAIAVELRSPVIPLTESLSLADSVSTKKSLAKSLSDSLSLSDQLATKRIFSINLADSVTLSDSLNMQKKLSKSLADSILLSDKLAIQKITSKSLSDSVTLSDQLTAKRMTFSTLSDVISLSDTVSTKKSTSQSPNDTLSMIDSIFATKSTSQSPNDTLSMIDSIFATKSTSQSPNDTLGLSDNMTSSYVSTPSMSELMGMADSITTLKIRSDQQLVDNNQTSIIVNPSKPHLVVISSNAALSTVVIPSTISSSTIDYSTILSAGTVNISHSLNITKDINGDNVPEIIVTIPNAVNITNTSWDGIITLPTVQSTHPTLPVPQGQVATAKTEIDLGSSVQLDFNKATRILFVGESGHNIGYFHSPSAVTEITQLCSADDQNTNNGLPAGGACKINVGSNLVVWTKHFTGFVTWTLSSTPVSIVPQVSFGGGGGYGVGASPGVSVSSALGVGALPGIIHPSIKIYQVSYDVCKENTAKIVVGTTSDTLPIVSVRTTTGISQGRLSIDQPYVQLYNITQSYITVFEVPITIADKYMNLLVAQPDGSAYVLSRVNINSCEKTVKFEEIPTISGTINSHTPLLFNMTTQLGNDTPIPSEKTIPRYATNQSVTVSGTVTSASPLDRAELRLVQMGENVTQYIAIKMNVTATGEPQTYNVIATIPYDELISPATQYWLWVENQDNLTSSSATYTIGVIPSYDMNATIRTEIPRVILEGTPFSPTIYLQNNANGSAYGTISLQLYNQTIATLAGNLYGTGSHATTLEWDSASYGHLMSYPVKAKVDFYGKSFVTNETMLYTVPSALSVPLSDITEIKSFVDENGNAIASVHTMYSSIRTTNDTGYKVIAPDGTCVIGDNFDCQIQDSTVHGNRSHRVVIDGQEFDIQYTGKNSPLQRFIITSPNAITGQWNVSLEKDGQEQIHLEHDTLIKIKYTPEEFSNTISTP